MRALYAGLIMLGFSVLVARADPLPQLYDVTGVAAGDRLNIRAAPSAASDIIGALDRDARGIEVVARNPAGTWGQVNAGERAGWVSMRYLAARGVRIDHYNLPDGLGCYGTEPFWSLANTGGALRYQTPDGPARDLPISIAQDSRLADDLRRMIRFAGLDGPGVGFMYPATCTDGMSDRVFGLSISVMLGPDSPMLNGCCSLSR